MTSQKIKEEHIGVLKFRNSKLYIIVITKPVDIKNIKNAGIDFLLRKTFANDHLQEKFSGPKIDNFL